LGSTKALISDNVFDCIEYLSQIVLFLLLFHYAGRFVEFLNCVVNCHVGLEFFETSAKDNVNVKAVFERLVDIICDKMSESLDAEPSSAVANSSQTRQLTASVNNNQQSSCAC